jgi:hypothetical protein
MGSGLHGSGAGRRLRSGARRLHWAWRRAGSPATESLFGRWVAIPYDDSSPDESSAHDATPDQPASHKHYASSLDAHTDVDADVDADLDPEPSRPAQDGLHWDDPWDTPSGWRRYWPPAYRYRPDEADEKG